MPYIKKLVMHGFKSFPRKTEIPFGKEINIILGANGSGKSNIPDAICFVLGRLSIKSMRAEKSKDLIFIGSKEVPPAKEASVELVFDNTDRGFFIEKDEISIERIVKKNGVCIYKINNETKTRQEVLYLLSQAGIDPNGFNIILQGEIQDFVKMPNEERRKIIEEVSGISVYETRKEKAMRELEKTEEKLKEVSAILRERNLYLRNIEEERQQALKSQKLKEDAKKFKASIIFHDLSMKKKEIEKIMDEISEKNITIEKIKKTILEIQTSSNNLDLKIKSIDENIQKATGFEQEKLNQEIADLRASHMGCSVRLENTEKRLAELERKKEELKKRISENELSIKELKNEPSLLNKKQKDLELKKQELEKLEEERKKFYTIKAELKSIKERIQDKNYQLNTYNTESNMLIRHMESIHSELFDKNSSIEKLNALKSSVVEKRDKLEETDIHLNELEKTIYFSEQEIKKLIKLKDDISRLDICPLCRNKITIEHVKNIKNETEPKIKNNEERIDTSKKLIKELTFKKTELKRDIEQINSTIAKVEQDLIKLKTIEDKKDQYKSSQERIDRVKQELIMLEKRRKDLEENFEENSDIERKYETSRIEVQEISLRSMETIDSEKIGKQRELERAKIELNQFSREKEDLNDELSGLKGEMENIENILRKKTKQEEELSERFKKMISEKEGLKERIRENEKEVIRKQNDMKVIENEMNELKITKAKITAEYENFETEMLGYPNVEIIKASKDSLFERLKKTEEILAQIGSVNMRAIEVYDSVKKEYESVSEKAQTIEKEKEGILKIIHEIDVKKRKTFNHTLEALNEIFSKNFSQLSVKGQVYLEVENKQDPFAGGVAISIKIGHGKYLNADSLSGGEQTLIALSLIFAIQEYSPYCFYVLDEVDAALDKRNSERLAQLLKKYMQKGQYIVITHNDELIANGNILYGVSMHEGVSKIVSLKI